MKDADSASEKCMMLLAQIAVKRHKFPSNPLLADPYTVGNVSKNIGDTKIT